MRLAIIILILTYLSLSSQPLTISDSAVNWKNATAGGEPGGVNLSDDFSTDPASRWSTLWGTFSWNSGLGGYETTGSGAYGIYNTTVESVDQYVKLTLDIGSGGPVFRSTGTASDGFYVCIIYSGSLYVQRGNNTGWLSDETSTTFTFSAGDTLSATVTGTGTSTTFRFWRNTTASTPTQIDGWDSAGDTADATLTLSGSSTFYNTGTYVGLGMDATGERYDNFFGGGL